MTRYRMTIEVDVNDRELEAHPGDTEAPPNDITEWIGRDLEAAIDLGIATVDNLRPGDVVSLGNPEYVGEYGGAAAPHPLGSLPPVPLVPADWPVQPVARFQGEKPTTCGTCGLTWDDGVITSMTPAPSGRCPFEQFHP